MLSRLIQFSIQNKVLVLLLTFIMLCFGFFSLSQIPIGAVPDITNNQVQVITTSQNLSTQDIEKFITYPIELEMANLPGVKEIRSVSKFGLSVVTIVFEDELGTYLPRQLIAEKIKSAKEKIPEGFGSPEMGPITTGLGEIYQYILDVKPGYENRYSVMDLRSIQDWIVRRQLSGIPGVVEVNTWGGYLKQYQVAINPAKLHAMNIASMEVFEALEKNNGVSGGAYIEKSQESYFIRGEGLIESLEDIEQVFVCNRKGIPIYVRDVAEVSYGHANRFGAITGNGTGEKVLGQVMMLKGADSKKVIDAVKERVASISKSLPEGIYINGFLDRSELIEKTTNTILENLILGCLIVIFVVVLMLGNWRSGIVVASLIPLSLLFALGMMYLFGVDANLMSLGAIDFGIIIDGAVIIVEYIAFRISRDFNKFKELNREERALLRDQITRDSADKMMHSAIYGQIIILIVFIPILSLQGIEGKMFRPMALVFGFALIGAMILCMTYIPVVSSLILKAEKRRENGISYKLANYLENLYAKSLDWAFSHKKWVISLAIVLFSLSLFQFNRLGAEFVPTLDEGDFVIQPVLKTGTSLGETILICTKIEKILLDKFPEVDQVVTRIGAAEVPTDPMSMEESDVIIRLKDKSEWVSAESKDELAALFKEELGVLGVGLEFTQPIEMRFNELITGVRADIAIKLYGEDLDILNNKAQQIGLLIADVDGAADISVEKTVGLPQMKVVYKRDKLARYGLSVAHVNDLLAMSFAGKVAGSVFEGERRYDLVLRLDEKNRKDLDQIRNLYVDLENGNKIPLHELADISLQKGAAKISRDDTRRRVVVGVNVRNRDLESVVLEIQEILDSKLNLPVGYWLQYGGQFENLERARQRLMIAIPIALLLIFAMLYFAFKSSRDALLIFSAIPLSAVGGIFLLSIRDMPFSISAGVGFIALFGIAVLNGIVMIEHIKQLRKEGEIKDKETLVKEGAKARLRAVLLTAMAAALGFLPMALSTNAGAEVQRPLATVVIGGLFSATLLTLLVLPILYTLLGFGQSFRLKTKNGLLVLAFLFICPAFAQGQDESALGLDALIELSFQNNSFIKAQSLQVDRYKSLKNSAFEFDKTNIYYAYDENNVAFNNRALKVWGVQQDFLFPTRYFAERKAGDKTLAIQSKLYEINKQVLEREIRSRYNELLYISQKLRINRELDSLYEAFSGAANRKNDVGESTYLERLTAASRFQSWHSNYLQLNEQRKQVELSLKSLVQSKDSLTIKVLPLQKLSLKLEKIEEASAANLYDLKIEQARANFKVQKQTLLPDLSLEYFQGRNAGINQPLYGYQFGVKIPLLFFGQSSKINADRIQLDIMEEESSQFKTELDNQLQQLLLDLKRHNTAIKVYEESGRDLSNEIIHAGSNLYEIGDIDYFQFIQSMESAYQIKLDYLHKLFLYNQTVIQINHLSPFDYENK